MNLFDINRTWVSRAFSFLQINYPDYFNVITLTDLFVIYSGDDQSPLYVMNMEIPEIPPNDEESHHTHMREPDLAIPSANLAQQELFIFLGKLKFYITL